MSGRREARWSGERGIGSAAGAKWHDGVMFSVQDWAWVADGATWVVAGATLVVTRNTRKIAEESRTRAVALAEDALVRLERARALYPPEGPRCRTCGRPLFPVPPPSVPQDEAPDGR